VQRVLLVAFSACAFLSGCSSGATARLDALRALVAQNVHEGDSPAHVIQFLDHERFELSSLFRSTRPDTAISINGHHYDNQLVIEAIKRNTNATIIRSESIQMVFVFNDGNKLIRYDLIPVYTSL
jgi:hypothetical protein